VGLEEGAEVTERGACATSQVPRCIPPCQAPTPAISKIKKRMRQDIEIFGSGTLNLVGEDLATVFTHCMKTNRRITLFGDS
jgi:hypothetical protein